MSRVVRLDIWDTFRVRARFLRADSASKFCTSRVWYAQALEQTASIRLPSNSMTLLDSAAATLTLPARAHNGYVINVKNGNAAGSGNNVTIARNGNNIDGAAANASSAVAYAAVSFVYLGAFGWKTF